MKCPHCGAPMKEDQIFCEKCGKERLLVPVYDAEVDAKLESTISSIADDLADTRQIVPLPLNEEEQKPDKTETETESSDDGEEQQIESDNKKLHKKTFLSGICIGIAAVVLLVFLTGALIYRNNHASYEYQLKMAEDMYKAQDYAQMLDYAKEAAALAPNSSDAKMMMARAYAGQNNTEMEQKTLEALLAADSAYVQAYDLLVPIYESRKEYEKIGQLLLSCKEQTVLDKYVAYRCDAPEFSMTGGSYDEMLSVKLIAPGSGEIYYTTNGRQPDRSSTRYITPIILDSGIYHLQAVYVNTYGVTSAVAEETYTVDVRTLSAPFVSLEAGTYTEPQMIEVETPSDMYQVYYTTDGSEPGFESNLYTGPIPLPLGESHFAFIMYDEKDNSSDIIYEDYSLQMELALSADEAVNLLKQALILQGSLTDADGHVDGVEGNRQYAVIAVISENDMYYYLLSETFVSPDGTSQKTGKLYAVCVSTGESFEAAQNRLGAYDLHKLQ